MDDFDLAQALTAEVQAIKATLEEAKQSGQNFNEAQTEFVVIDPLLKRLGYSPLEIHKQGHDSVAKSFPDYTLLPGKPQKWFLEAKKLDLNLQDGEAAQAVSYAFNQGSEWAVLTNGRRWYIYNAHLPKPLAEKRVLQIDDLFVDDNAVQKLILLSKVSMLSNALQEAWLFQQISQVIDTQFATPNSEVRRILRKLGLELTKSNITDEMVGTALLFTQPSTVAFEGPPSATAKQGADKAIVPTLKPIPIGATTTPEAEASYYMFDEIAKDLTLATYRRPNAILFPNGSIQAVKSWADVAQVTVNYIGNAYGLPLLPFSATSKGKNVFLSTVPMHGPDKKMASYRVATVQSQSVYIDTNRSTLNICASILALFKAVHVPLTEIKISID